MASLFRPPRPRPPRLFRAFKIIDKRATKHECRIWFIFHTSSGKKNPIWKLSHVHVNFEGTSTAWAACKTPFEHNCRQIIQQISSAWNKWIASTIHSDFRLFQVMDTPCGLRALPACLTQNRDIRFQQKVAGIAYTPIFKQKSNKFDENQITKSINIK